MSKASKNTFPVSDTYTKAFARTAVSRTKAAMWFIFSSLIIVGLLLTAVDGVRNYLLSAASFLLSVVAAGLGLCARTLAEDYLALAGFSLISGVLLIYFLNLREQLLIEIAKEYTSEGIPSPMEATNALQWVKANTSGFYRLQKVFWMLAILNLTAFLVDTNFPSLLATLVSAIVASAIPAVISIHFSLGAQMIRWKLKKVIPTEKNTPPLNVQAQQWLFSNEGVAWLRSLVNFKILCLSSKNIQDEIENGLRALTVGDVQESQITWRKATASAVIKKLSGETDPTGTTHV